MWASVPFGCRSPAPVSEQAKYEQIHSDFLHGNLDTARQEAERARLQVGKKDTQWAARFELLEAEIRTYQGRRPDVVSLLACSDNQASLSGDLAIKRNLLCALANARLGHSDQSAREIQAAQALAAATHSHLQADVLMAEGHLQYYQGHSGEAADLYNQSLQAARVKGDAFLEASDLLNMGVVALSSNRYDEAMTRFQESADLAKPIQARIVTQAALGDAGLAQFDLGDFDKALESFRRAEQEAAAIGTTSGQVSWIEDAALTSYQLGNLDQAAADYQRALALARTIRNPEEISGININLGFLSYKQGNTDLAQRQSEEALSAARQAGDQTLEARALYLQAVLAVHHADDANALTLFQQLLPRSASIPSQETQIESQIAAYYVRHQQPVLADTWYRRTIATYEADRAQIHSEELRLPYFANGGTFYNDYADFLIASGKSTQALRLLDQGRARTLAEGLGQTQSTAAHPVAEQALAKKLNATLLFYSLTDRKSYLWAIDAHRTVLYTLPKQADIATRIEAYNRSILKSNDPVQHADANARSLYDTLILPAASMLPHDGHVIVIPDGPLNSLNFETLLTPANHYWIEDVTLENATSIRLLAKSNPAQQAATNLLLLGDPVLNTAEYEALPNAPAEVTNIANRFLSGSRTVLTRASAIPSAYAASAPEKYAYIHFTAHATASEQSPLDSAVVLSAAPGQPEDYKLYAREIIRHPLHARLVTVSACYGSGLRTYAGEGLVGLSWAFLRAGSHHVIAALWEANDASTPLLMDHLYAGIQSRLAPETALRDAKLTLIHSPGVYRKPLYWAAFQLYTGS